jgi:hypothetical protein
MIDKIVRRDRRCRNGIAASETIFFSAASAKPYASWGAGCGTRTVMANSSLDAFSAVARRGGSAGLATLAGGTTAPTRRNPA